MEKKKRKQEKQNKWDQEIHSDLTNLSDDCLVEICVFLTFKDILALSATCRNLRNRFCPSSLLWKCLVVAKYPFLPSEVLVGNYRQLFQSCEEFISLWIDSYPCIIPFKLENDPTLGAFPSESSIVVASAHSVKSFGVRGKRLLQETCTKEFKSRCTCAAWNGAFSSLFLGFQNGAIFSWKEREGFRRLSNKKSHSSVSCIESKSHMVASGTADGKISLFHCAATGKSIAGATRAHVSPIICLRFEENGNFLASFGRDGIGKLWCVDRLDCPRHVVGDVQFPPSIVQVDRDESKPEVFYIASDKAIHIWDIRVGGISAVLSEPLLSSSSCSKNKRRIKCMKVLSSGSIVTGNSDGSLLYWPPCGSWNGIQVLAPSFIPITSIANDNFKFLLGWENGSLTLLSNTLQDCRVDEERLLTRLMSPIQSIELIREDLVLVSERSGRVSGLDFSMDNDCIVVENNRTDSFLKWLNETRGSGKVESSLVGKFWNS